MGKTGKDRKKRKLMQQLMAKDTSIEEEYDDGDDHDLEEAADHEGGGLVHKQLKAEPAEIIHGVKITGTDLATTVKVLSALAAKPDVLKASIYKPLRAALHAVHKSASTVGINGGHTLVGKVSDALSDQRWEDAMEYLAEMRTKKITPRLGALQRWVRECDAAAAILPSGIIRRNPIIMKTLDAVMRTADPASVSSFLLPNSKETIKSIQVVDCVRHLGHWNAKPDVPLEFGTESSIVRGGKVVVAEDADKSKYKNLFDVIAHEDGPVRRPANLHPMTLYTTKPATIDTLSHPPTTTKVDMPGIPNVFMLKDFLSEDECRQVLLATESIGYTPDEPVLDNKLEIPLPLTGDQHSTKSVLAHNVFWLADAGLIKTLEDRARSLLPSTLMDNPSDYDSGNNNANSVGQTHAAGSKKDNLRVRTLAGINPRWRVYRYVPGSVYRPHIDGAWPRSEYNVETGTYTYDASNGKRWSRLTLLIYLNEGFEGGETTYFCPSEKVGVMDARAVIPRSGCAMVFPHGCLQTLVHEGSGVTKGAKYIIRADILYDKVQ